MIIDRQVREASADPKIPIVSDALHIASMTVIVFLRCDFGLSFLRPKSIFFALGWPITLFAIYAWFTRYENGNWAHWHHFLIFAVVSFGLWLLHLFIATLRQFHKSRPHDLFSGSSWIHLPALSQDENKKAKLEAFQRIILEPGLALAASAIVRINLPAPLLADWLTIAGTLLFFKETLNYWNTVRKTVRTKDSIEDAKKTLEPQAAQEFESAPLRKKEDSKAASVTSTPKTEVKAARQYARLLGMEPPYSADKAFKLYREKIKATHPDVADIESIPEEGQFGELREAMKFFQNN